MIKLTESSKLVQLRGHRESNTRIWDQDLTRTRRFFSPFRSFSSSSTACSYRASSFTFVALQKWSSLPSRLRTWRRKWVWTSKSRRMTRTARSFDKNEFYSKQLWKASTLFNYKRLERTLEIYLLSAFECLSPVTVHVGITANSEFRLKDVVSVV